MIPKLSIAIHSGVFDHWPLLQNLLKSFLVCNEYPSIEIMLVESGGNKKIRDWFEKIDFDDFFVNLDGQKTDIKKHPAVKIEKTLKFLDFPSSFRGMQCWSRTISQCIDSFKGDFFVLLAEDNQFVIKGDIISDYIKILDHFGRNRTSVNFFSNEKYKYMKKNNKSTGPHKLKTTDLSFFVPIQQKYQYAAISSRELYNRIDSIRDKKNIKHEDGWHWNFLCMWYPTDEKQGVSATTDLPEIKGDKKWKWPPAMPLDFKRIYPAVPCGIWIPNLNRSTLIKKILDLTKLDPSRLLYQSLDKVSQFRLTENLERCLYTEEFLLTG